MAGRSGIRRTRSATTGVIERVENEIIRVRKREERRLIKAADRAGYFRFRIASDEIFWLFQDAIDSGDYRRSTLAKLLARREGIRRNERSKDARRKALLGSFLVAQCRHKPEIHAALAPDIRKWTAAHPHEGVAERNLEALKTFFADPDHEHLVPVPAPTETEQARRLRTNRLILLGAWVMAHHKDHSKLSTLISDELTGFLAQGRHERENRTLLKDVLRQ